MAARRAYLVDTSIYIFRGWHAYSEEMTDADGMPSNAVYGFTEFLHQLIEFEKPEYIACAFDAKQTRSYRRELFPEYKANRPPAPPELKNQFRHCRSFCRAAGIADYSSDRYEADDIIGTLATRLRDEGFSIVILSADKDLAQLIRPGDIWWDFARDKIMHYRDVEKAFGVPPELIADLLALAGDAIDNIPGIPGVGYKMASNLLKKYPSVEAILDNIANISKMKFRGSGRIQQLVEEHHHILPLNKLLTTIVTDAEFVGPRDDIRWQGIEHGALAGMLDFLDAGISRRERWLNLQLA
jgi:DNA polymerase-1